MQYAENDKSATKSCTWSDSPHVCNRISVKERTAIWSTRQTKNEWDGYVTGDCQCETLSDQQVAEISPWVEDGWGQDDTTGNSAHPVPTNIRFRSAISKVDHRKALGWVKLLLPIILTLTSIPVQTFCASGPSWSRAVPKIFRPVEFRSQVAGRLSLAALFSCSWCATVFPRSVAVGSVPCRSMWAD